MMGEVVKLKRQRNQTIKGAARETYSEAVNAVGKIKAVAIIAMGEDGTFASRIVFDQTTMQEFDVYARAGALMEDYKLKCIEG